MTPSEQAAHDCLRADGWTVLRNGWPDFLCFRRSSANHPEIIAVEVKHHTDRLQPEQKAIHRLLMEAGLPIYLCYDIRGFAVRRARRIQPAPPKTSVRFAVNKKECAARDCSTIFTPRIFTQKFCSPKCYNRESQRAYRERQKEQATA
jgi:hypothetical protein